MHDLWFSPYELQSAGTLNACSQRRTFHGALIRHGSGYGCIHPWAELGDLSLQESLTNLDSPLMQRALVCAEADGRAREQGVSLFKNLPSPQSHATLTQLTHQGVENALLAGFTRIKVKAFASLSPLIPILNDFSEVNWRLDFNNTANETQLRQELALVSAKIDFVEDPFPFHHEKWSVFQADTGVTLANDLSVQNDVSSDVLIIKPAVNRPEHLLSRRGRKIFTTYMDHPLGQTFAAWQAALHGEAEELHGLQTHLLFEPTPFSEALGPLAPKFKIPQGPGLGFQDLLEALDWQPLMSES